MAREIKFRFAGANDCPVLAGLNHQLIRDEGHRNKMTLDELEDRMRKWLATEYKAVIFEMDSWVVAYVLYREQPEEIYLRQIFVVPEQRRQGIGRTVVGAVRSRIWPRNKRLTVEVLTTNAPAIAFWRSVGYKDYCLTMEIMP